MRRGREGKEWGCRGGSCRRGAREGGVEGHAGGEQEEEWRAMQEGAREGGGGGHAGGEQEKEEWRAMQEAIKRRRRGACRRGAGK